MGCSIELREGEEELDLIVYIYPCIYKYPGVGTIKLRYRVGFAMIVSRAVVLTIGKDKAVSINV